MATVVESGSLPAYELEPDPPRASVECGWVVAVTRGEETSSPMWRVLRARTRSQGLLRGIHPLPGGFVLVEEGSARERVQRCVEQELGLTEQTRAGALQVIDEPSRCVTAWHDGGKDGWIHVCVWAIELNGEDCAAMSPTHADNGQACNKDSNSVTLYEWVDLTDWFKEVRSEGGLDAYASAVEAALDAADCGGLSPTARSATAVASTGTGSPAGDR